MYCDALLFRGETSMNHSRPPGAQRYKPHPRRIPTPRHGIVCKNKTQCRRNRRAGGVGAFFRKKELDEDET
jgi:hypothetical protein